MEPHESAWRAPGALCRCTRPVFAQLRALARLSERQNPRCLCRADPSRYSLSTYHFRFQLMYQRLCERINFSAFRRRDLRPWYEIRRWQDDPERGNNQPRAALCQCVDQVVDAARSFIDRLCAKDRYSHTFEAALWNGCDQMPHAPAGVMGMGEASQHQHVAPYRIAGSYRSYRCADDMGGIRRQPVGDDSGDFAVVTKPGCVDHQDSHSTHLIAPAPHCARSEHTTAILPCRHSLATGGERSVTQCVILLNPGLSFRNAALRHGRGILRAVDGLSGWAKAVGGEPRLPERTSAARLSPDPRWPPPKATCMLASAPPLAPVALNQAHGAQHESRGARKKCENALVPLRI